VRSWTGGGRGRHSSVRVIVFELDAPQWNSGNQLERKMTHWCCHLLHFCPRNCICDVVHHKCIPPLRAAIAPGVRRGGTDVTLTLTREQRKCHRQLLFLRVLDPPGKFLVWCITTGLCFLPVQRRPSSYHVQAAQNHNVHNTITSWACPVPVVLVRPVSQSVRPPNQMRVGIVPARGYRSGGDYRNLDG